MEELIKEVENAIYVQDLNIQRQKKYYNYPLTNSPDHYYRLMMLQKNMDTWQRCLELIKQYKKERWGPLEPRRSKEFEAKAKVESNGVPGFVTKSTLNAMLMYMKRLECRIEELEVNLINNEFNAN
ncbi:hypothetical protein D3C74_125650 [compost metagenome]